MKTNNSKPTPRTRGSKWMSIRDRELSASPLCAICYSKGIVTPGKQVDHKTPLFKGGTDDPANLQVLCEPCHMTKTIQERGGKQSAPIGIDGYPLGFK
jgi:5-methylcytosine-specific restriction protein A